MSEPMIHPDNAASDGGAWNREQTLQLAWTTWLALLAVPFVVLPFALHLMPGGSGSGPRPDLAERWFPVLLIYLLVALPAALAIRAGLFKSLWRGRHVRPRVYYVGMLLVWAVVMSAGLAAELVCVRTGTLSPNLLPAALALAIYFLLMPTDAVMYREAERRDWQSDHISS